MKTLSSCLILLAFIDLGLTLECYVCDNQEDNRGKCVTTIKTCEYGENVCLTEIKWGSTPYWQQGALKQYYVSKKCSTKEKCENYRKSNMPYCTHIWYQDWKCSECCKGDRCNYYIISGSSRHSIYSTAFYSALLFSVLYTIL
ncbi:uncharacterized protein cold [Tribolium castaneum]|uniref:UPAR/Ly6 domain-containing protein n=1 Tax=Tribolium castaneum TaxID=7070 RepID=A0A139WCI5_TRICA|nr:PREDICTED: uncharacterized protein LOC103314398 [Tribolium castaneum]KYB25614.1 hypothetical protein TcasGA2_TC034294 [Tribolium castaneum]|eukprot:XP_008198610.1 PREDICTED: uncharacterized protein LOC103314398 [Tribolium castaneum]